MNSDIFIDFLSAKDYTVVTKKLFHRSLHRYPADLRRLLTLEEWAYESYIT